MRLYLDTSIIGAMSDEEMPERIRITRALLDSFVEGKHSGIISNIVLEEIDRCPEDLKKKLISEIQAVPVLVISENEYSADLLEAYEKEGFIRKGARLDLRHLAVATVIAVWMLLFPGISGIS